MTDQELSEQIEEDYKLFYTVVKGMLQPMMQSYEDKFKEYDEDLYNVDDEDIDLRCKVNEVTHLTNDFLYDAKRMRRP